MIWIGVTAENKISIHRSSGYSSEPYTRTPLFEFIFSSWSGFCPFLGLFLLFGGKLLPLGEDIRITVLWLYEKSFCWKCKFSAECVRNNLLLIKNSPPCFKDSRRHSYFVKSYGEDFPPEEPAMMSLDSVLTIL